MIIKRYIFIILFVIMVSCGGLKGEFAIRTNKEEKYKRIHKELEFNKDDHIDWIYKFRNVSGRNKIGVILLKKEFSWIDIKKKSDYVDGGKKIIYGTIKELPPGEYQIYLTDIENNNNPIAKLNFSVFTEQ